MTDPIETPRVTVSTTPPAPPPRRSAGPVLTALGLLLLAMAIMFVWTQVQDVAAGLTQLDVTTHRLTDGLEKSAAAQNAKLRDGLAQQLDDLDRRLRRIEQDRANPQAPTTPPADGDVAAIQQRLAAVEQKLAAADLRQARADQARAAARALAAGQPLGIIPSAPPALARYADSNPPTEAGLRQEFPTLATRAAAASKPATEADGIAQRMWLHVQSLVTIKDRDKVLVGAPASFVLGEAQDRLTAGDLAGAVAAISALDPAAGAIMADWRARAQALLDARAAVAAMPGAR